MGYTDLTTEFAYRDAWFWQRHDALAENDDFLLKTLAGWRRPVLKYISATALDVENNTGTLNQTKILFPDGELRTVYEDTASTNVYRRFLMTSTAQFTTGTEDSGLRSGLSEANSWYAIYAVKSQINPDNFVLVGDTISPTATNFSTLNSRYGTDSWVYLGLIYNGKPQSTYSSGTGDIFPFIQVGNFTEFVDYDQTLATNFKQVGPIMDSGLINPSYTFMTVSPGYGAANIPEVVNIVLWSVYMQHLIGVTNNMTTVRVEHPTAALAYTENVVPAAGAKSQFYLFQQMMPWRGGGRVNSDYSSGQAGTTSISLTGFFDGILLRGSNAFTGDVQV